MYSQTFLNNKYNKYKIDKKKPDKYKAQTVLLYSKKIY